MVPWLSVHEQAGIFPDKLTFSRPEEQEAHIKKVLRTTSVSSQAFARCSAKLYVPS